jgi:hypothetical protein
MEPFKALTLLASAGVVSLVGAGAAGFYAGYTAARGNLDAPIAAGSPGSAVSLKPVLEDIRALSRQVETLSQAKPRPAADNEQTAKPVLDEIKALARQIDGLKSVSRDPVSAATAGSAKEAEAIQEIREQVRALNAKFERQEPKAPKALVDEIRALSASIQTQEPAARRVIAEEVRSAVTVLQNTEQKVPKALLDEIRTISANVRTLDGRPQVSVIDQIKILTATVEALKSRLEGGERAVDQGTASQEVAQLRQLIAVVSEKCQAPVQGAGLSQPGAAIAVSQTTRQEPSTIVFYDNVMLKKDQEKQYDEIGVRLALQSVAPRQVRVAVNRQGFGLAFGERKVFRSQDVECELNLMETNLNDSQARVSISCKR